MRQVRSNFKGKLAVFSVSEEILYQQFFPPGQEINGLFYRNVSKRLREPFCRENLGSWPELMLVHSLSKCACYFFSAAILDSTVCQ
jgi:hypothetical protein